MLLAGPISHISIQYMDFVEIFNVSLDLSTLYFTFLILVGVEFSFVYGCYSCYSVLECYNLFNLFNLFLESS